MFVHCSYNKNPNSQNCLGGPRESGSSGNLQPCLAPLYSFHVTTIFFQFLILSVSHSQQELAGTAKLCNWGASMRDYWLSYKQGNQQEMMKHLRAIAENASPWWYKRKEWLQVLEMALAVAMGWGYPTGAVLLERWWQWLPTHSPAGRENENNFPIQLTKS